MTGWMQLPSHVLDPGVLEDVCNRHALQRVGHQDLGNQVTAVVRDGCVVGEHIVDL
jgi:hypothetical protein